MIIDTCPRLDEELLDAPKISPPSLPPPLFQVRASILASLGGDTYLIVEVLSPPLLP
jgi:hypothetical protein